MPTTSNFGWTTPADTDLVKNGALAIRTLGNGIDTSMAELKGGTTGQVLSKSSNTDMDFTWVTTDDANAIQNAIVDAKGDLIAATANDTPARLAVGNNGETLVADSSTSTGLRYNPQNALANPVINGGLDTWQRGTSFSIPASTGNTYFADRWSTKTGANQALTVSRQATGDTTNLPNIQYCFRYQRNSGQTGTAGLEIFNSFETANSLPFSGRTVTLSFYARAGANFSGSLLAYLISGTGTDQNRGAGSYTGEAYPINAGSVSMTTTWQRYAFTGTIASTANELTVYFNWAPSGTAGTNDFFEITGVQIDLGTYTASTAPAFRRAGGTLAGELAACQRYYYRNVANGAFTLMTNMGAAETATNCRFIVQHPVTMRVAPTTIEYSTLIVYSPSGGTNSTVTSFSTVYGGTQHSLMTAGVTGLTANASYFLYTNNSTAGYIAFGAEL